MYQVYAILLKTENPIIVEKYILFNFNKTSHKKMHSAVNANKKYIYAFFTSLHSIIII